MLKALVKRVTVFPENAVRIEWNFRDELAQQLLAEEIPQRHESAS